MRLTFEQGRVLGAMIEKAMTTPANYPMSLNAVQVACNQVSNRHPVVEFAEPDLELVLRGLADDGLAKMVHRPGDRVVKYRQALNDQLQTTAQETALLAVLLLRGAQTPGELRQRTTRYVEFTSLPELETVLNELARRGLVMRLERQPGQKESRYQELLTGDGDGQPQPVGVDLAEDAGFDMAAASADAVVASESPAAVQEPAVDLAADLAADLADLKRRFEILLETLGEEIP